MKRNFLVLLYLSSSSLLPHLGGQKHEISSQGIFGSLFDVVKNIFKKKVSDEVDSKLYQRLTFDPELHPNLTFDNIVGYEKEIETIVNILPILKSKNSFKTPIILNGHTHSGKKTFVHAVAHMINAPTITIDCSKVIAKN